MALYEVCTDQLTGKCEKGLYCEKIHVEIGGMNIHQYVVRRTLGLEREVESMSVKVINVESIILNAGFCRPIPRLSRPQGRMLNNLWSRNKRPSAEELEVLASDSGLSIKRVCEWFERKNRKRIRPPTPETDESSLKEEVKRLRKEIAILKGEQAKALMENPEEFRYLDQIQFILDNGITKTDRTNTGTISVFGMQARYSLRNGTIPLLTTKLVYWEGVLEELLWFIRGETDSKTLSAIGVNVWDAVGSRQFLDNLGFTDREEGDLGPVYGFQWRHSGAEYKGPNANYEGQGVDQLAEVIEEIKKNPDSRRIIMSAWNPSDLKKMALPPCHTLCQFYVLNGELSCQVYQRSGDMGLGVPFNLASYGLLTHMIAHVCKLKTGDLVHTLGDAHVYSNHVEALTVQLNRSPTAFPTVSFADGILSIDDFTSEKITLNGYHPQGPINMEMAV